jgi:hypothetical protein
LCLIVHAESSVYVEAIAGNFVANPNKLCVWLSKAKYVCGPDALLDIYSHDTKMLKYLANYLLYEFYYMSLMDISRRSRKILHTQSITTMTSATSPHLLDVTWKITLFSLVIRVKLIYNDYAYPLNSIKIQPQPEKCARNQEGCMILMIEFSAYYTYKFLWLKFKFKIH